MKKDNLKILVIRFSSIGDIVLTTPVIRCLKQQLDGVELHYLTKRSFEAVLASNPYIDRLHFLDDKLSETIGRLKAEKYDLIVDLHHNLRTLIIKARLGVRSTSFDKLNWQKWLIVNFKINRLPAVHIVDRYLKTVQFLNVQNDEEGLDYFLNAEYDLSVLLPKSHQEYIGLVIGAQHATKRLPQHQLIKLCQDLGQPIVLLGGPDDAARAAEICEEAGPMIFNGCGKFSLDQSAYLVRMARQVITHDTGLMHIASAFKKPVISVWGNTIPEFGMYPYKTSRSVIAEVKHLGCRPCSKIGYNKCPLGHFKCMNDQDIRFIVENATNSDQKSISVL
ncbi:glycosyltransferase family 9 protein [Flavihumibacter sp. R14]|nr:glycosyltransferase family 9 protein [Flavihumibacter soli]